MSDKYKLQFISLYTKLFTKITISQKLIDIFIHYVKNELIVHTLSVQIKAIYNFFEKRFIDPLIPLTQRANA